MAYCIIYNIAYERHYKNENADFHLTDRSSAWVVVTHEDRLLESVYELETVLGREAKSILNFKLLVRTIIEIRRGLIKKLNEFFEIYFRLKKFALKNSLIFFLII